MKRENTVLVIIAGLLAVAGIGLCVNTFCLHNEREYLEARNSDLTEALTDAQKLPSLPDIQERLGIEPDGIYGAVTKAAWEKKLCQQHADKWNFYYEVKK